ncbi:hypothetical protein D9M70_567060 [compost metagenome]
MALAAASAFAVAGVFREALVSLAAVLTRPALDGGTETAGASLTFLALVAALAGARSANISDVRPPSGAE